MVSEWPGFRIASTDSRCVLPDKHAGRMRELAYNIGVFVTCVEPMRIVYGNQMACEGSISEWSGGKLSMRSRLTRADARCRGIVHCRHCSR